MAALTEIQIRTFVDDNKLKPPGCSMEGPPGYDSVDWNIHRIQNTPYYKILFDGQIFGGLMLFDMGDDHFEVGRIWVDPGYQDREIGQGAMQAMFNLHPDVMKWTLGTPLLGHSQPTLLREDGICQNSGDRSRSRPGMVMG